jgi:hypothetical protein
MKTVHRYGVYDENWTKMNTILIDHPFPAGYHPGYGKYLVDEGPEPNYEAPPAPTPAEIEVILSGGPLRPLQVGETWNPETGEIIPAPTPEPAPEPEPSE